MRSPISLGSRIAPLAILAMALGMACFPGARAPNVAPRGTLAPGSGAEGPTVDVNQPFGVVFGAPRGETSDPPEISLVFNRPMRPLDLAGDEASPPATLKPAVPGRWSWVGTSALNFIPEGHLPRATPFVVEVPAGTKALDGSTMEKPFTMRFSTARPAVVSVDTVDEREGLRPETKFTLRTNQPIAPDKLAAALTLKVGDKQPKAAFDVRRPDPQNEQLFSVEPRTPLPLDTDIDLTVAADLVGREGSLASGREQRFSFRTYGPLRVTAVSCDHDAPHGRCDPQGAIGIELSNRVKVADLKRAVRIEPDMKVSWPSWMDDDQLVSSVSLDGHFQPAKKVEVRVAAGLTDEHGQRLAADYKETKEFDDLWPSAAIGLRGSLFEPVARRDIPVEYINAKDVDLAVAPLSLKDAIRLQDDPYSPGNPPSFEKIAGAPGARVTRLPAPGTPNKPARHLVRTEELLGGKNARGVVAIGIRYTAMAGSQNARSETQTVLAKVSDLGVSAKLSHHGSLFWVSRLSTAAPVKGAELTLQKPDGSAVGPFRADDSGFVTVPEGTWKPELGRTDPTVIVVKDGDDWSYEHVEHTLSGYRFDAPVETGPEHPFGLVFTDRGIYRPGDVVHLKGIFRKEGHPGTVTPAGLPVSVRVDGPDGDAIATRTETLSPFGTVSIDVTVPKTGRLGTYAVRTVVGEDDERWADASADFEVAEYRPAEFKVSVESDKPSYVHGDKARWIARGDYLYGAPMSGADARLVVTRSPADFSPPDTEGFITDAELFYADLPDKTPREGEIQSKSEKLDAQGQATIDAALTLPGQRGPERVTAEAEVADVSRQYIAGSTTAIVHPAAFYLGISSGDELFVDAKKPIVPEVLAVEPNGKRVAGVKVKVDLVQRTWTTARQATQGGSLHTVSTAVDKVVASCNLTTADKPVTCSVQPSGAGYYLLHATATDSAKNTAEAADAVYVFGAGESGWGDGDRQKLELVADKTSYEVGQTAKILVKSPFASADALVTVERAGIHSEQRVKLSGPMPTIEVPITDALRPNAFVSVLLVRGRSKAPPAGAKEPDVGAPAFRLGYTALEVNPEKRRLAVAVKPSKTDAKPGENLDVDLAVTDAAGKPARAEVTFYAVDEGVLSLIGYKTPDPIEVFGAPRPLRVLTLEARAALARVWSPFGDVGVDKGLDGGDGGPTSVRRDFRASAYFNPTIVTDDKGHARVSFRLPDTLTTYRLMAVTAAEDDRFGYAEARVTASRPLMARPALPRFLRAGDAIEAGVVVSSKGMARTTVEVEAVVSGVVLAGDAKRTVDLQPGTPVEVRFPMNAPKVGPAKLSFRVRGQGADGKPAEDAVEVEREVKAPIVPEAVALYGDTESESGEKLGDLGAIRDDVGGLEVSLASTALVGLGGSAEQLIDYPYLCTEQLTSRLVPLLPLRDLARDYHLPMPQNTDAFVASTVAQIIKRQRGDGGFGMWDESAQPNLWASTYALWGLGEAKRRGVTVPAGAIESATGFVRQALERIDDPLVRATAPFILDVLAENGNPDPGRTSRLFAEREELPLFAKALLAHAMVLGKSDAGSIEKITAELEGALRLDANTARAVGNAGDKYAVLMDSDVRTSALVLRALLAARPSHPLAAKLAMGLLADRQGGTWRNTQETAWSLLSLDLYRKAQEKTAPDFTARVFLGQDEVHAHGFQGRTVGQDRFNLPAGRLASASGSTLAFDVDGKGRLFYEARLRYARKQMPTTPLERGFFVTKTLRPITAAELTQALTQTGKRLETSFQGGSLVLGEIVVVTPSPRQYVVIDDPLPAGFEPIDARLATTAGDLGVDRPEDQGEPEGELGEEGGDDRLATGEAYLPSAYLRELRDDRVLFFVDHMAAGMYRYRYLARATTLGTFVLPPARAEEMYTPEVFGRTGAATIHITAK